MLPPAEVGGNWLKQHTLKKQWQTERMEQLERQLSEANATIARQQLGTVSSADRLSQGVIAWPQVPRIPMKTSKKSHKKRKPEKIGACGGPWDPIPPPHGYPLGPPRAPRGAGPRGWVCKWCAQAYPLV